MLNEQNNELFDEERYLSVQKSLGLSTEVLGLGLDNMVLVLKKGLIDSTAKVFIWTAYRG